MNSEDAVKEAAPPDEDLEDGEIEDDDDEDVLPPPAAGAVAVSEAAAVSEPPHAVVELERPPQSTPKKKHLTEAEKSVMKLHKLERLEREKRDRYKREQMHVPEPVDDYAVSLEKALAKVLKKDQKPSETEELPEDETRRLARGKKRKKKDKHKKAKRSKQESPKNPEDEIERRTPEFPDAKSEGESSDTESSTDKTEQRKQHLKREARRERAKRDGRDARDRDRAQMDKNRQGFKKMRKRNIGICLYYLQGKCNDEHCQYSHDCVQPLKLELCKFYLLDCCAKGDKCLYMHSDFPCKYYHTGIPCPFADDCKFAHGGPLPESVKQILFKHIETAPKEILGNFPRLSRENAHMMITQAQKNLEMRKQKDKDEISGVTGQREDNFDVDADATKLSLNTAQVDAQQGGEKKEKRNRRSRWQDPEPESLNPAAQNVQMLGFQGFKDQDMRINSNGDVDMRAHNMAVHPTDIVNPNIFTTKPPPIIPHNSHLLQAFINPGIPEIKSSVDIEQYKMDAAATKDKPDDNLKLSLSENIASTCKDVDLRIPPPAIHQHQHPPPQITTSDEREEEEEDKLQIVMEDEETPAKKDHEENINQENDKKEKDNLISFELPKVQRDLFARIQHQQKDNTLSSSDVKPDEEEQNIDWYSDDEDDNKLTIEHEDDEPAEPEPEPEAEKTDSPAEPPMSFGDLSKFDIAEVSKLLSTIKENSKSSPEVPKDPRRARDPRLARQQSTEEAEPMTIYEQTQTLPSSDLGGNTSSSGGNNNTNSRLGRSDVDLRMGMHFKALGNYTPASEIDASVSNHPVMTWKVYIVEIPKPDYTGLKLSASDAHTSGDPRLRKIFRLSTEEKDSPASPGSSPKPSNPTPRVDPRRKKAMEAASEQVKPDGPLTYAQQLSMLQSSPFYQSLTSNQKLMLNQELASRNDQSGMTDPIISAMLANLGLQSGNLGGGMQHTAQQTGQALNILNSLTGFAQANPLMSMGVAPHVNLNVAPPNLNLGQGLLGPAPGHHDFNQMNQMFDPRANMDPRGVNLDPRSVGPGILGNPPPPFAHTDFPPGIGGGGGGGNSDDDEYGQFDNGQYAMYNSNSNHQQRGLGQNMSQNQRERNNRRGRNNNNNNRNRNNFFRHNNHRNNRNRNSPS